VRGLAGAGATHLQLVLDPIDARAIETVGAVLADLDVLVQPSTEPEGFPRSAMEASAMGVPVIATGHGGVAEIVRDGVHGRLVPPGDRTALAEACVELAVDDVRRARMARAIRNDSARLTAHRMCADLASELWLVSGNRRVSR